MKNAVRADAAPPPAGPYSHAIVAGGFAYLAGQGPFDPETGEKPDSFEEQARQTFTNLEAVARATGGSLENAVRVGVFLRDMQDFAAMNRVYGEFLQEPYPARTTVQVELPGFEIEVDAVLWLGDERGG